MQRVLHTLLHTLVSASDATKFLVKYYCTIIMMYVLYTFPQQVLHSALCSCQEVKPKVIDKGIGNNGLLQKYTYLNLLFVNISHYYFCPVSITTLRVYDIKAVDHRSDNSYQHKGLHHVLLCDSKIHLDLQDEVWLSVKLQQDLDQCFSH